MPPVLTELVVGDDPESWRRAGFSVDDGDTVVVGTVTIRLAGADEPRSIRSWGFADVEGGVPATVDGIRTVDAEPSGPHRHHANGVRLVDHVVVLSPQEGRTVRALAELGLDPRRTRDTDQYGMPMRQTFFVAGEAVLELITPVDGADEGPTAFFGIAYTVDDLDATVALLGDDVGAPKDAVQPGRRIVTLRHRNLGLSVPTAFMSPPPL